MLRNYLATAFRNMRRTALYVGINIVGLSVGLAAVLIIALFVRDELSFDTWVPGYEDVYRLRSVQHPPNERAGVPDVASDWIRSNIFDAVHLNTPDAEVMARLLPEEHGLRAGDVEALDTVFWADSTVFQVFPFPVFAGDLSSALVTPDSAVVTRRTARKYFGRDDVVGEFLELNRAKQLQIKAVIEDLPARAHLNIDVLASQSAGATPLFALTYLRLRPGVSASRVEQGFPALLNQHLVFSGNNPYVGKKGSEAVTMTLQPLSDVHMAPQWTWGATVPRGALRPSGDPALLRALSGVGVLILFVAGANFVTLMTARYTQRAVEVGVRKTSGASRAHLIVQFVAEGALYVFASFLIAVFLLYFGAPAIGGFLLREDGFVPSGDARLILGAVGACIVLSGVVGFYPAAILTSLPPARAFKQRAFGTSGSRLRQVMVVGQFAVLISLILVTLVMSRQTVFAMNQSFQTDADQLVFVETPCVGTFKEDVRSLAGVRGAACANASILGDGLFQEFAHLKDGSVLDYQYIGVDAGFLELSGVTPLAGRFFTSSSPPPRANTQPIVINETARRAFGFSSPEAALGQNLPLFPDRENPGRATEVIGVVADFPVSSLRDRIQPMRFYVPARFSHLVIKVDGVRISEALSAIDRAWTGTGADRPIKRFFFDQHVQATYIDLVRSVRLFSAFAGIAVFIGCLGLFGLSAFATEQRTKEIGIRKSMGATRADILRLMLWQFARPVLWANVVAWPFAYFTMRHWLNGFAYRIDLAPWMFVAASALALVIALITVIGHALLVARAHPVSALRYE